MSDNSEQSGKQEKNPSRERAETQPTVGLSEWRSMESAPKDGSEVRILHEAKAVYLSRKDIWVSPDGGVGYDPLAWQSISQPATTPKAEESEIPVNQDSTLTIAASIANDLVDAGLSGHSRHALAHAIRKSLQRTESAKRLTPDVSPESSLQHDLETFPPDCPNGTCKKCHRCYANYVEEKIAGELDPESVGVAEHANDAMRRAMTGGVADTEVEKEKQDAGK